MENKIPYHHCGHNPETCQHRNDSLYPHSLYQCDSCGTVHGTRAYGGAVNWQCPRELVADADYHKPAHQTYVGFACVYCGESVPVGSPAFLAQYPNYQRGFITGS